MSGTNASGQNDAEILTPQPPSIDVSNTGLLPVGAPDAPTGAVLTVGAGEQYATLAAAAAAAPDGATILVDAGTYMNDFATVSTKITIEGVGGMANFVATVPPPNYKGILTVDNDVTIKNLSFSGSAIPDAEGGNGAGIRYEGGQMVLQNDSFSGNQNGLLAFPVMGLAVNTISIDHSVFSGNGSGSGYTHNMYVGAVTSLTATKQRVRGRGGRPRVQEPCARQHHHRQHLPRRPGRHRQLRHRLAERRPWTWCRATSSRRGLNAQNDAMVHFGGEGIPYAGSSLTLTANSIHQRPRLAGGCAAGPDQHQRHADGATASPTWPWGRSIQGPAVATGSTGRQRRRAGGRDAGGRAARQHDGVHRRGPAHHHPGSLQRGGAGRRRRADGDRSWPATSSPRAARAA